MLSVSKEEIFKYLLIFFKLVIVAERERFCIKFSLKSHFLRAISIFHLHSLFNKMKMVKFCTYVFCQQKRNIQIFTKLCHTNNCGRARNILYKVFIKITSPRSHFRSVFAYKLIDNYTFNIRSTVSLH